jgi:TolB protein
MPTGKTGEARPIKTAMGDNYSENFGLDWTPDGKLVYGSHANGNADIYVMSADGAQQRQLTFAERRDIWPVVSANGKVIVFCSQGGEPQHIWRVNHDGSDLRQLTFGKGEGYPTLSPDGRWVVYPSAEAGQTNLWKVSIEGGTPVRLTHKPTASPAISPDGRFIACLMRPDPNKPPVTVLLAFEGGEPVKIFDQMPIPDWRLLKWMPDGSALTYIVTRDGVSNLWSQPIDGSAPRQITEFKEDQIYRFAWSRDGRQLALDRGITVKDIIWLSDFR